MLRPLDVWLGLNILALYHGIFYYNLLSLSIPIATILILIAHQNVSSQIQFDKYINAYYGLCICCILIWSFKHPFETIMESCIYLGVPLLFNRLKS